MANRLADETSPYLLQHAHNPVDWYPWGEDALRKAQEEDRPILLSIGYSACHWCHVMERESFENEEIARLMNELFVNIKVDREERPDLDSIYMTAVQAMTGRGGWPMTVFLTPEGVPFFGGTYFPPEDRHGMHGFPRVLVAVAQLYRDDRDHVSKRTFQVQQILKREISDLPVLDPIDAPFFKTAYRGIAASFDFEHGGFGSAPKFPQSMTMEFLLRYHYRTGDPEPLAMVELTLQKMAFGGIYDQLGGGFHRYSVDERWLVPHFEKMLYDNALLSRLHLEAYLITGKSLYRRVAEETLDYALREMQSPEGGFYSTQDADSEGEEGKYFLWESREVVATLGPEDGRIFNTYYDVTERGNFEGKSILNIPRDAETVADECGIAAMELQEAVERGRRTLFALREGRVKPARDEKVLSGWNGLMLRSLAEAGRSLGRPDYVRAAIRNADFVLKTLKVEGRLLRTYKDGQSKLLGYLEDYAYCLDGLLPLKVATFDPRWFQEARFLADEMIRLFWDESRGGFFFTGSDHEALVSRPKEFQDNVIPSGNSVAAEALLRLSMLTGESQYAAKALANIRLMRKVLADYPSAFGRLLCAAGFHASSPKEVAVVGEPGAADTEALLKEIFGRYHPHKVVAGMAPGDSVAPEIVPLLRGRPSVDGRASAYVCQGFVCQAPTTDPEELARQLAQPVGPNP